jgi:hypothetical protein
LDEEDVGFLEKECGGVGKGVRELVRKARERAPYLDQPRLRTAYFALTQNCEAEGEIKFKNAIEVLVKELGLKQEEAIKTLQDLCREGFLETSKTGWLRIGDLREKAEREVKMKAGIMPK